MRCSKSRYLCDLELVAQFENFVVELAWSGAIGDTNRQIYLNLVIRKSAGKTDKFGNYIFEVEASNENVDLQDQIVLQKRAHGDQRRIFTRRRYFLRPSA